MKNEIELILNLAERIRDFGIAANHFGWTDISKNLRFYCSVEGNRHYAAQIGKIDISFFSDPKIEIPYSIRSQVVEIIEKANIEFDEMLNAKAKSLAKEQEDNKKLRIEQLQKELSELSGNPNSTH